MEPEVDLKHELHPHAAALERIGRKAVIDFFGLSQSGYSTWKVRGVPPTYHKALAMLAVVQGVPVPELGEGGL